MPPGLAIVGNAAVNKSIYVPCMRVQVILMGTCQEVEKVGHGI